MKVTAQLPNAGFSTNYYTNTDELHAKLFKLFVVLLLQTHHQLHSKMENK